MLINTDNVSEFPNKFVKKAFYEGVFIVSSLTIFLTLFVAYLYSQDYSIIPLMMSSLFWVLSGLTIRHFNRQPNSVILYEDRFLLDEIEINLSELQGVNFTLPRRELTSLTIEITLNDNKKQLFIYPRMYYNHRLLRNKFEQIVVRKGIPVTVEERGL